MRFDKVLPRAKNMFEMIMGWSSRLAAAAADVSLTQRRPGVSLTIVGYAIAGLGGLHGTPSTEESQRQTGQQTMRLPNWKRTLAVLLASAFTVPAAAHAETASSTPLPSRLGAGTVPAQPVSPLKLTRPQLHAFAQLVGDEPDAVSQRLLAEPGLVPLVAAAADARLDRRSSGRALTIGGFTAMGVGLLLGGAMVISALTPSSCAWEDSSCHSDGNDGEIHAGLAIMLVSMIVGPAVGIPGIVKMARVSDVETHTADLYQGRTVAPRSSPSPYSFPGSIGGPQNKAVSIQLGSFAF